MRRRPWLLFLLLAFLLLSAVGCSSAQTPAPEPSEKEGSEPAESAASAGGEETEEVELIQTFADPKTGLTLGVPDKWTAVPMVDAMITLISPQNGEEDFFLENAVVTADDQFEDLTMEAYLEALNLELRNRYPDTETLESGDITIADLPAHWMVDKFTGPKGEARVYRVVVIRENVAYVLHGTSPVWSFDRYRPVFEAIAKSATWVDPASLGPSESAAQPAESASP